MNNKRYQYNNLVNKLPIFIIISIIILLFIPVFLPTQGKMIFGMDIYDAYFYWKNYLGSSIRAGIIPFWNPYNFSGTPFLAHPNINIFYPPNWIFILFSGESSFALYFCFHILVAALTMYWLGRKYSDRWGALASALIYAFSGYFAGRIYSGHLEYIDTASWIPLSFGLAVQAIKEGSSKNIILAGIGMAVLLFSGNELFFLFTMEMIWLYLIYSLISYRRAGIILIKFLKSIKVIFLSLIIGFGFAAVEILPRMEFISRSIRSRGIPYELAASGSLPWEGLKLFLFPFLWGSSLRHHYTYIGPWPNLFEYLYYVGKLPVLATFITLIFGSIFIWKKNTVIKKIPKDFYFFTLIVIPAFILISLGLYLQPNIHEILWKYTPFYKGIRFPARHLFLVAFSLSITGGIAVGILKQKIVKALLIILIVFDLVPYMKNYIQISDMPINTVDPELVELLRHEKELVRLLPDFSVVSQVRRDLDFGSASYYQYFSTSDYNSMILWRYYHFIEMANGYTSSAIPYFNVEIPPLDPRSGYLDFLNIKYLLADTKFDSIGSNYPDRFKLIKETSRYRLYQNQNFLPRFFLVYDIVNSASDKETERLLLSKDIDLKKSVILLNRDIQKMPQGMIHCINSEKKEVIVRKYSPNKIILDINTDCDAVLSSSEIYYPGWRAKVDGMSKPIILSNYSFRSLFIPKGSHIVEIYYFPDIYFKGATISIIVFVLTIFLFQKNKFEKKK